MNDMREHCRELLNSIEKDYGAYHPKTYVVILDRLVRIAEIIRSETIDECARVVRDDRERIGNWKRVLALKTTPSKE
jgi:hypothetical protein